MIKKLSDLMLTATSKISSTAKDLATEKKLMKAPHFSINSNLKTNLVDIRKKKLKNPCSSISTRVLERIKKAANTKRISRAAAIKESFSTEVTGAILSILEAKDPDTDILRNDTCSIIEGNKELDQSVSPKSILDATWFKNRSDACTSQQKNELSRSRKEKYAFKNTESSRFSKLMKLCASKIGSEATLDVFDKFGRERGIKDYNALLKVSLAKARASSENPYEHIHKIFQLFFSMRERGFEIYEGSYGPFLEFLIDRKMGEEFHIFSEWINEGNHDSHSRMAYYEMLFWIKAGDEDKVHELCNSIAVAPEDCFDLSVSYLLAFCETDRKEELSELLEVVDITNIPLKYMSSIFKSLGRLQHENCLRKFISELKIVGDYKISISSFIYDYTTNIPNLEVEDAISNFNRLHEQLEVLPSVMSCDKLIKLCCDLSKVPAAAEVVNIICRYNLDVPSDIFDSLLHACERCCEYDMVHPIYSTMQLLNLKPIASSFKSMISLSVRIKDFEGAYNMLSYAKEINVMPTASMYNAIMAGYFKEKNPGRALVVWRQMIDNDVQPDSETYFYLISNADHVEHISKYQEEMRLAGIEKTKIVYMALINAFTNVGNLDLAKQVVLDQEISSKYLNELKSVLISALSSNGHLSDALDIYDEVKQEGGSIEPKAIIGLIEHTKYGGELDRLLEHLKELGGSSYWFDGCSRVVLYCVQHNVKDSAIKLLKEFKEKDEASTYMVIDQIFSHIWQMESTNIELGMDILSAVKKELQLRPSRTSLDFLLSSCIKVKEIDQARLLWSEYQQAGLPYNVLTYLRMYQAFLASGEHESAEKILKKISKEDPHIKYIIKACNATYLQQHSSK